MIYFFKRLYHSYSRGPRLKKIVQWSDLRFYAVIMLLFSIGRDIFFCEYFDGSGLLLLEENQSLHAKFEPFCVM